MEVLFDATPVLFELAARFEDDKSAAQALGIHRESIIRWRRDGVRLKEATADVIAVRLGLHPTALWPDWYERLQQADDQREATRRARITRNNQRRRDRRAQSKDTTT